MSSSAVEGAVEAVLADALAMVHRDAPSFGAALAERIASCAIDLQVDLERFTIDAVDRRCRTSRSAQTRASLRTSRETVAALLDGRAALHVVVRSGELRIRASRADVRTVLESLALFLHGCARCTDAPMLRRRLDGADVEEGGQRHDER